MPRFSLNVSFMLTELPFLERFAAAAALGFCGVDVQFPYGVPAARVAAAARAAGVEIVLINLPLGRAARKGFGADIALARAYAEVLGVRRVNVLATGGAGASATTLVRNLREAADAFADRTVMVEPVNGRDVPGFLLQTTEAALAAIDAAGRPNLALQFDLYHRQVMQGDLVEGLRRHLPRIAHVQFADVPGRHEPGTGEIAFDRVFAALDAMGYAGWVGAEYRPTRPLAETLGWMRPPNLGAGIGGD